MAETKIRKTKGNYIFPDIMAKMMSKVSQRVQYESSLLSAFLILLGLLAGFILTCIAHLGWYVKTIAIVNEIAGMIFLSSMLVTTYQQYKSYLDIMGLITDNPKEERKKYKEEMKKARQEKKEQKEQENLDLEIKQKEEEIKRLENIENEKYMPKEIDTDKLIFHPKQDTQTKFVDLTEMKGGNEE